PLAAPWEADAKVAVGSFREVDDHHHVIAGTSPAPALIGQRSGSVIDVENVDVLPCQPGSGMVEVAAQPDQVVIHPDDAAEPGGPRPVNVGGVPEAEVAVLQHLLALKEH